MPSTSLESSGLSLLAAAAWGGGDFTGGLAARRANVFGVVAVAHSFGFAFMLALALLTHEPLPPALSLYWGAFAGISGAFGIAALYRALAVGRMGVIAPVTAVVTGVLPVLFSLRSEGLPEPMQLCGFALALVGIWLVARPDEYVDSHRGLGLAVLAGGLFAMFLLAARQAGQAGVFWPLATARLVSTLLMVAIVAFAPRHPQPLRQVFLAAAVCGFLDSAGNALFVAATRHGRLDVAVVLSSLYPASTVILARVLLKERISRMQGAGVVCALLAVALIAPR